MAVVYVKASKPKKVKVWNPLVADETLVEHAEISRFQLEAVLLTSEARYTWDEIEEEAI
jgi:hypothetical protein